MREILYRGQTRKLGEKVRIDGTPVPGNWVYGGVYHQNNRGGAYSIIYSYDPTEKHVVWADTVGEYTGRTDKNKTKIFEHDILWDEENEVYAIVSFADGGFIISEADEFWDMQNLSLSPFSVVGNIHDNPEIVKCLGWYKGDD